MIERVGNFSIGVIRGRDIGNNKVSSRDYEIISEGFNLGVCSREGGKERFRLDY